MKRSVRILFVLALTLCALTVTAFADMGPKPQLTVKVEHPPQEIYYLDLLRETDHRPGSFKNETLNAAMVTLLQDSVPSGWRACLAQPVSGAPIYGSLTGEPSGDTMLHTFRYFGVPDVYRVLIVTESGEVWMSDSCSRTALQSSATVDWETKEVSIPSIRMGYALQFLATFLPTLLLEGLILFLFRYRQKRSWAVFGVTNLVSQGALAAALSMEAVQRGVSWGFLSLLIPAEIVIVVVEAIAYVLLLKERDKEFALSYALAANAVSAVVGWLISEPVWRFVVSIS